MSCYSYLLLGVQLLKNYDPFHIKPVVILRSHKIKYSPSVRHAIHIHISCLFYKYANYSEGIVKTLNLYWGLNSGPH
jgi:hypothetical protein